MIRNFLTSAPNEWKGCHGGLGTVYNVPLFAPEDFVSRMRYFNYTVLPQGTSIGFHRHGQDEEVYIVLEGTGALRMDDETIRVKPGDVIVNRPFGAHSLTNDSDTELKIVVFEMEV